MSDARLGAARGRIADVLAAALPPVQLGDIQLRPEQRIAAARVADLIDRHGGALLADEVGRGKTFVALAVARRWTRPLVLVPASLRDVWREAMRRAGVSYAIASHESLSRGRRPDLDADGVIVDESHRFRSLATNRHRLLAALCARTPVLLMSATPLQNHSRDLAAQLSIFLGSGACALAPEKLARFVVRTPQESAGLPTLEPPEWIAVPVDDEDVLNALLALPPPARAIDAGDGGVLRVLTLVRAWASSRAALVRMLGRRLATASAIELSARDGVWPSRRELRAWFADDDTIQLGFPALLGHATVAAAARETLCGAAAAERAALAAVRAMLGRSIDPDLGRIAALRALRRALPGERLLAFSELATTVRAYWNAFQNDKGVGMLTSHEARIASGRIARAELLARFAPRARGAAPPVAREQVTLLIATDLLSEGVNLQDASVVVHLDLPWNPARLAQRVGRVRRIGGAPTVRTYVMAPPASAELLLSVEHRLRRKLAAAERAIGRSMVIMPALTERSAAAPPYDDRSTVMSAEALGEMHATIGGWQRPAARNRRRRPPALVTAAAVAPHRGWLAAFDDGRLVASIDGCPPSAESAVDAVKLASGPSRRRDASEIHVAREALSRFLCADRLERDCGMRSSAGGLDRAYERRIAAELARVARHERAAALILAQQLGAGLQRRRSLGVERELLTHLRQSASNGGPVDWLSRAIAIVAAPRGAAAAIDRAAALVALILFGPA